MYKKMSGGVLWDARNTFQRPGSWFANKRAVGAAAAVLGYGVKRGFGSIFGAGAAKRRRIRSRLGMNNALQGRLFTRKRKRRFIRRKGGLSKRQKRHVKGIISGINNATVNSVKNIGSGQITFDPNECVYTAFGIGNVTDLEACLTSTTDYYKDAGNGTGNGVFNLTADGPDKFRYKFIKMLLRLQIKNNGQVPVRMSVYYVRPKKTQDTLPMTDYADNDADVNFSVTNPQYYPKDSDGFRRRWKTFKTERYLLNGGDEVELMLRRNKPRWYRPEDYDEDAMPIRKGLYQSIILRCEGVPAHDSTNHANVGLGDGTLDYVIRTYYKWSGYGDSRRHYKNQGAGALDEIANDAVVAGPTVEEIKEAL